MLALFKRDGTALGQVPVVADWEPAMEAVRFCAHRRLGLSTVGVNTLVEFRPVWSAQLGEPYLGAVEALMSVANSGTVSCRIPTAYFKSVATDASRRLVSEGQLQAGETFEFLVLGFPNTSGALPTYDERFIIEEVPVAIPLKASVLGDFLSRAIKCGENDPQDIPIFIPQFVLDDVVALTLRFPKIEVASVLIGNLHRDAGSNDIFIEVTAQIPARNSETSSIKVTFGPETYQAVQSAISLRGLDEQWVGWFHSHPASAWCNPLCSVEARARCPLQRVFFSQDDCDVHRTLFGAMAYGVGLLITNTDAGLQHALFAWRNGIIVQRGFYVIDGNQTAHPATSVSSATIGENENEKCCSD